MPFYVRGKGGGNGNNIMGGITLSGELAQTVIGKITTETEE